MFELRPSFSLCKFVALDHLPFLCFLAKDRSMDSSAPEVSQPYLKLDDPLLNLVNHKLQTMGIFSLQNSNP